MKFIRFILEHIKVVVAVAIVGVLTTIGTMAYRSTNLYKATQALPAMLIKIKYNTDYINDEIRDQEKKDNDIAVGIRYNVSLRKFYWRDADKEYRPIYTDSIGTFYRNDIDRKVYIKF